MQEAVDDEQFDHQFASDSDSKQFVNFRTSIFSFGFKRESEEEEEEDEEVEEEEDVLGGAQGFVDGPTSSLSVSSKFLNWVAFKVSSELPNCLMIRFA